MNASTHSKFVGVAPLDALAEEVFFAVDDEGGVGYNVESVLGAEDLGGEGSGHAAGEVVDG